MTYDEAKDRFLSTLPEYIGFDRVLSQHDGDQGDSLQRMGTLYALLALINDEQLTEQVKAITAPLGVLEDSPGIWVRSTEPGFWGNDPRGTSRDQLSIAKLALQMMPPTLANKRMLWDAFKAQMKRATFHQNYYDVLEHRYHMPDLMVPYELSVYARELLGPLSYVITWFFDLGLGIDMLLRNASDLNRWSQDNMLAVELLSACHQYPSLTARVIMYFYKKTNFMERIKDYHSPAKNGCEPLYYLYCMAFLKLEEMCKD